MNSIPLLLHLVSRCHLTPPTNGTPDFCPAYELLLMMPSLTIRHSASVTALCFFIIPVFGSSLVFFPALPISSSTKAEPTPQNIVFLFIGLSPGSCPATALVFFHNARIRTDADIDFSVCETKHCGFSTCVQRSDHKCAAVFSLAEVTRSFDRPQPESAQQLHSRWTPLSGFGPRSTPRWTAERRSDLF